MLEMVQAERRNMKMVDMFNASPKNTRNRRADPNKGTASVNEQIVKANLSRDATETKPQASPRILNPDLTSDQKITETNTLAKNMKALIDHFALKIAHDEAFNSTLRTVYDAKRIADNGALWTVPHLERLYTKDEIQQLPRGGTTEKDVEGTNHQPDKFSITKYDRVEAEKKTKSTSFYRELAEQMDVAQDCIRRWDNLRLAKKKQWDKMKLAPGEDASTFKQKNVADYDKEIGVCSDAIQHFTKWIRQGASFLKQMVLASESKSVKVIVGKGDDGNYFMRKRPVTVRIEPPTDDEYEIMTVGSFLSIDIQAAIDNGDTWDTWQKEMSREAPDDDDEDSGAVKSVVDFEEHVAQLASWWSQDKNVKERHTQLMAALTKKGSDDFVVSVYHLWSAMDGLVPHIKNRALALIKAENDRLEAEAEQPEQKPHPANQPVDPSTYTPQQLADIAAWKAAQKTA
jgi:hypothetical protein